MATTLAPDVALSPVGGDARPIEEWVTTFHLLLVALDPFKHESSWLIDTGARVLRAFAEADCRVAWLVAGDDAQATAFLGPLAGEFLTFADPDKRAIEALGLQTLPALVHVDQGPDAVGVAEGWNPDEWRAVATDLATAMSWTRPAIPGPDDPTPYAGVPVS